MKTEKLTVANRLISAALLTAVTCICVAGQHRQAVKADGHKR